MLLREPRPKPLVMSGKLFAVVVSVNVSMDIVDILLPILRDRLLLVVQVGSQIRRLSVLQVLMVLVRLLSILGLRWRDVGRRLNDRLRWYGFRGCKSITNTSMR
ncbi:hypothetical protein PUN28_008583 [Cardiocondyla obscurior]|uniref:Uncharacterized protein n=1 Tax=Cardiocondyla obscurior TaxID=286306 RepID=A0AAW2G153_9HYME